MRLSTHDVAKQSAQSPLLGALQRGRWRGECGCGLLRGPGRPMGVGFRPVLATAASEAALAQGLRRVGCALRLVPFLAVVARHGFGNSENTQLSKENSD